MTVQLEMRELIMLLLAFAGLIGAFGKLLLAQFEKRLDERFRIQESSRAEAASRWDQRFTELQKAQAEEAQHWHRVERDLLSLKAELPREYVRREDHIRFETVINAKLDSINTRLDLMTERQLKKE